MAFGKKYLKNLDPSFKVLSKSWCVGVSQKFFQKWFAVQKLGYHEECCDRMSKLFFKKWLLVFSRVFFGICCPKTVMVDAKDFMIIFIMLSHLWNLFHHFHHYRKCRELSAPKDSVLTPEVTWTLPDSMFQSCPDLISGIAFPISLFLLHQLKVFKDYRHVLPKDTCQQLKITKRSTVIAVFRTRGFITPGKCMPWQSKFQKNNGNFFKDQIQSLRFVKDFEIKFTLVLH